MDGSRHPQAFAQGYQVSSGTLSGGPLTPSSEEELHGHDNAWPFPSQYQAEFANPALYNNILQNTSPHSSSAADMGAQTPQYDPYSTSLSLEDHLNAVYKPNLQGRSIAPVHLHSVGALINVSGHSNRRFASS